MKKYSVSKKQIFSISKENKDPILQGIVNQSTNKKVSIRILKNSDITINQMSKLKMMKGSNSPQFHRSSNKELQTNFKGQHQNSRQNLNSEKIFKCNKEPKNNKRSIMQLKNRVNVLNNNQLTKQIVESLKEERYYIKDVNLSIKKQIRGQTEPTIQLTHLLQSMAVFHTFKHIKPTIYPHLSIQFKIKTFVKKPTIIFDMDQTLLHCSQNKPNTKNYIKIQSNKSEEDKQMYLQIRPYAQQVLFRLSQKYQIGIFTAAMREYADCLLDILDPKDQIFSFRLYRQHCCVYQLEDDKKITIKDLRILKNRNLKEVVIVDNSPVNYIFQPQNGIPIFSFYGNAYDNQLLKLQRFLKVIEGVNDVKPILKDYFLFHQYHKYPNARQLVQKLY